MEIAGIKKIVVCPDSFKGTFSAREAAEIICGTLSDILPAVQVDSLPVADGGEGSLDAIKSSLPCVGEIMAPTLDPLGRTVSASYIISDNKTAYIESASASGLTLLASGERDIFRADTYGTGLLIAHAWQLGIRDFVVCMGGTATCDGGYGAYRALRALPMKESTFSLLCDVENPLCGPEGAAAVFGPQKGASPEDIPVLDAMLRRRAEEYRKHGAPDISCMKYAGAAGGLAGMLMGCFGAVPLSGIEKILELIRFQERIKDADLIITGEGKADLTTLKGKAPKGILEAARISGVPVVLIGGKVSCRDALMEAGFHEVVQATPDNADISVSRSSYLGEAVRRLFRT